MSTRRGAGRSGAAAGKGPVLVLAAGAVLVVVLAALAVAGRGGPDPTCGRPSSTYGRMCDTIFARGRTVDDVIAVFTLPSADYLSHLRWDFELTTYRCDPRGATKQRCAPDETRRGPTRLDSPPAPRCVGAGPAPDRPACVVPVVGEALASRGDLGVAVPWELRGNRWVCVEVARLVGGRWVDNGRAGSPGERACTEVHQ